MAYIRPCGDVFISDSWQGHKDRKPKASSEPGVDYAVAKGTDVVAPADGEVIGIKDDTSGASGRAMMIRTGNDYHRALHLSEIVVKSGGFKKGHVIARSGASANGSNNGVGAHLHWTFWHNPAARPRPGETPTQDFEAFLNSGAPAVLGEAGLEEEDDMFTDDDRKLLQQLKTDIRNTHAGIWLGGSVKIGANTQKFNFGVLPIVVHNQELIAKQAGEIAALKAIVEQLTARQNVAIDEARVTAARTRGIQDANTSFLNEPTRSLRDPRITLPLEGAPDDTVIDAGPIDPNIVNPPDQAEIDSPAVQPGEPDPGGPVDPRLGVRDGIDLGAAVRGVANPGG